MPSILHETHFLSEHEGLALSVDWHERGLTEPVVMARRTVTGAPSDPEISVRRGFGKRRSMMSAIAPSLP